MALMNKQIDYSKKNLTFSIISATYLDNIENFIFVEAHKIDSVRESINGLNFCYQKIDILQEDEMTKIYEDQQETFVRPNEGQFVRIKTGLYQNDLGVVFKI